MMGFNLTEIHDLTLDEIAGLITDEEKAYLYKVIAENQDAFTVWQELHRSLGPQEIEAAREAMHANPPQLIIQTSGNKKSRIYIYSTCIAVLTLLIIILARQFLLQPVYKQSEVKGTLTMSPKEIRLQLANGKTLNLSGDTTQTQINGTVLTSINKTLRYISATEMEGLNTLTVPVGKDYNIVLSDGTEVQLNSATELTFPMQFKKGAREISIKGEAYLKVAKNVQQPFIVHLSGASINVLGTEFNVNTYDTGVIKVALVNGAVRVKRDRDSLLLKPGYGTTIGQAGKMQPYRFDQDLVLSWRKGIYEFGQTTLREVCRILPRWYGTEVIMDNPATGEKSFLGSINRNEPLQNFLKNLHASDNSIDYYFDKEGILHFR